MHQPLSNQFGCYSLSYSITVNARTRNVKETKKELRWNAKCPCGSGKSYGDCCKKRDFKWVKDKKGITYRQVKMSEELVENLKKAEERFEQVFGRKPGRDDKLFIDQYRYDPELIESEFSRIALEAGVGPPVVYASEKTGLIVTEENLNRFTELELEEWDEAIAEYYDLEEQGIDPFLKDYDDGQFTYVAKWVELEAVLDGCVIHLGRFIENMPRNKKLNGSDLLQYFWVQRTFQSVRSILVLVREGVGADCLPLVRSIYDNYLRISYLRMNPESAEDFLGIAGLSWGTHEYVRNDNGKLDRRRIRNKESGQITRGHISSYKMAERSGREIDLAFFDDVYDLLSSFVHSDVRHINEFLEEDGGLKLFSEDDPRIALQYSTVILAMLLDELRLIDKVKKQTRLDLLFYVTKLRKAFLEMVEASGQIVEDNPHLFLLVDRLSLLGKE